MKIKKQIIIIPVLAILIILLISINLIRTQMEKYKYENEEVFSIEDRTKNIEKSQGYNNSIYEVNAWIKVQGTNIDVPVIGYKDKTKDAIHVNIDSYAWQPDQHKKLVNKETLIGHNLLNLSSQPKYGVEYYTNFEDLMAFVYYDFAKDNKYIQYTINGKNYVYKVFSVFFDDTYLMIRDQFSEDISTKKMKEIVKRYQKESIYKYDVDVNENDKIITLDTCTRFYGVHGFKTFTVQARMLRQDEKMNNYKVEKADNYKKIEKIVKEKGEENEEI